MESNILSDFFSAIRLGEPFLFKNIKIIPIETKEKNDSIDCFGLRKAIDSGMAKIKESGTVNKLFLTTYDKKVFILSGELLTGGKQNRIVNSSFLVSENSKAEIPTSCVEKGRWRSNHSNDDESNNKKDNFGSFGIISSLIEKDILKDRVEKDKKDKYKTDQQKIWNEVDSKMNRMNVKSSTSNFQSIYNKYKEQIDESVNNIRFRLSENTDCIGFMVFKDEYLLVIEILNNSSLFNELNSYMLERYLLEAYDEKPIDASITDSFINECIKKEITAVEDMNLSDSLFLGKDIDFKTDSFYVSGLIYNDKPLHLKLYSTDKKEKIINLIEERQYDELRSLIKNIEPKGKWLIVENTLLELFKKKEFDFIISLINDNVYFVRDALIKRLFSLSLAKLKNAHITKIIPFMKELLRLIEDNNIKNECSFDLYDLLKELGLYEEAKSIKNNFLTPF